MGPRFDEYQNLYLLLICSLTCPTTSSSKTIKSLISITYTYKHLTWSGCKVKIKPSKPTDLVLDPVSKNQVFDPISFTSDLIRYKSCQWDGGSGCRNDFTFLFGALSKVEIIDLVPLLSFWTFYLYKAVLTIIGVRFILYAWLQVPSKNIITCFSFHNSTQVNVTNRLCFFQSFWSKII